MKKLLFAICLLLISLNLFANNYGVPNSEFRVHISVTGETSSGTTYDWTVYNQDGIVSSGSDVMYIPEYVLNKELFIASNRTFLVDGKIVTVTIEDEVED